MTSAQKGRGAGGVKSISKLRTVYKLLDQEVREKRRTRPQFCWLLATSATQQKYVVSPRTSSKTPWLNSLQYSEYTQLADRGGRVSKNPKIRHIWTPPF